MWHRSRRNKCWCWQGFPTLWSGVGLDSGVFLELSVLCVMETTSLHFPSPGGHLLRASAPACSGLYHPAPGRAGWLWVDLGHRQSVSPLTTGRPSLTVFLTWLILKLITDTCVILWSSSSATITP